MLADTKLEKRGGKEKRRRKGRDRGKYKSTGILAEKWTIP
jgi:hypothetical protein